MLTRQVIEVFDLLDRADASGEGAKAYLERLGAQQVVERMAHEDHATDFVRVCIPGSNGRVKGGPAPTIGILGRLGGLGARPEMTGFV